MGLGDLFLPPPGIQMWRTQDRNGADVMAVGPTLTVSLKSGNPPLGQAELGGQI